MPAFGPKWAGYAEWTRRVQADLLQALRAYAQAVYAATDAYFASLGEEDMASVVDLSGIGMGHVSLA